MSGDTRWRDTQTVTKVSMSVELYTGLTFLLVTGLSRAGVLSTLVTSVAVVWSGSGWHAGSELCGCVKVDFILKILLFAVIAGLMKFFSLLWMSLKCLCRFDEIEKVFNKTCRGIAGLALVLI